jgi:hypothetical protein
VRDRDGRFPEEADEAEQQALMDAGKSLEQVKADGVQWFAYHEIRKSFIQWQDKQKSIQNSLAADKRWKKRR